MWHFMIGLFVVIMRFHDWKYHDKKIIDNLFYVNIEINYVEFWIELKNSLVE